MGDPQEQPPDHESELLDIAHIPLDELITLDGGALDNAIRRICAENADEPISSWSSFADRVNHDEP